MNLYVGFSVEFGLSIADHLLIQNQIGYRNIYLEVIITTIISIMNVQPIHLYILHLLTWHALLLT